jgi:ABC-type Na+ efflux pump permease subunit
MELPLLAAQPGDVVAPGDLRMTWLIARRGAIESLRDRMTVGASALLSLVVPIFVVLSLVRPRALASSADLGAAIAVFLLGVGLGPAGGAIGIAAGLFAGEKEQGNLLPLLATPASNRAIFAGKVLAAVLPALIYSLIAEATYLLEVRLLLGAEAFGHVPLPLALGMATLVPANAVLGAAVASVVSSRVRTYQSAQMLAGLALYPIMGLQFGVLLEPRTREAGAVAIALVVIVLLDALLILLGAATWRREEVLARR